MSTLGRNIVSDDYHEDGFTLTGYTDSAILVQHMAHRARLTNGVIHDCGGGESYGTHGVYEEGIDTWLEKLDISRIKGGQCISHRCPNVEYRCYSHDSTGGAFWLFDYSAGGYETGTLVIREATSARIGNTLFYTDGVRKAPGSDANLGPSKLNVEIDHCILDCRNNSGIDANHMNPAQQLWLTNNIVISDAGSWLHTNGGVQLHNAGNLVVSTAALGLYFKDFAGGDFTPVAGSPAVGKAVASPARSLGLFGSLPDVGPASSAPPPPPPPPPPTTLAQDVAAVKAALDAIVVKFGGG